MSHLAHAIEPFVQQPAAQKKDAPQRGRRASDTLTGGVYAPECRLRPSCCPSQARAANASFVIGQDKPRKSLMPDTIATPSGHVLRRPDEWR